MRQIISLLFVVCVFSGWGMSQAVSRNSLIAADGQPKDGRLPDTQVEPSQEFIIGPEDILSITVWKEPDLTNRVTVRPDGKIGIPLLNDVQAGGLAPKQLQEQITEGLKQFVSGPQVSVIVQEIQSEQPGQKMLPEPEAPDNCERVKVYMTEHPTAKTREVAKALSISPTTANKWMRQLENDFPAG